MLKLTFRTRHALAAILTLAALVCALPNPEPVSAAPEPDEAPLLDTATGATCDPHAAIAGPVRGVAFAASDASMPLSVNALEIHFVAETDQLWEDVRVQVQFWDGREPRMGAPDVTPAREIREVSLGARQFSPRSAHVERIRFEQPATIAAGARPTLAFSLQGKLNGIWMDTDAFSPCLRPEGLSDQSLFGASRGAMGADAVTMLKVFGVWLTPPPTLPPIPKPTDTPTPAPPLAARAFVPVAQR